MRLDLFNYTHMMSDVFDFVVTNFDNGRKYGVWYDGKAPLNAGKNGTHVGQVAHVVEREGWSATADDGHSEDLRWTSGFRTRKDAARFLAAQWRERQQPRRFWPIDRAS